MNDPIRPTILIVDDDRRIRMLLTDFLSSTGYNVITAQNGREALEILKEKSFDLLIADVNMPEMDGIALTRKVRDLDMSMVIVGMSVDDRKNDILKAGADHFLLKPLDFRHLKSILNSFSKE
ncbi:MAG: response regulator [Nitrospirota bacterium]